jgi:guanylate kinase
MKTNSDQENSTPHLLIVISGPSGVGKDTILNEMKKAGIAYHRIVTVTTRDKRKGEVDGKDYHFTTVGSFKKMMKERQLLEWAKVYDNYYGVPLNPVKKALNQNEDVIIKVDVQGVSNIKKVMPEAVAIFLSPPSEEELERRLTSRGDENSISIKLRLKTSKDEYKKLHIFDYIVENHKDDIELTLSKISSIISAEKCRISRTTNSK